MVPNPPSRDQLLARTLTDVGELAEPLERDAILQRIGRVAAESVGADLGFVGLLDGADKLALTGVHGGETGALEALRVERGRGLGGKVLAEGSPSSVVEYANADSITHEYDEPIAEEGLSGVLCMPLSLGDELLGVAYVSHRVPTVYSDVMISNVLTAVESAKVALTIADRSRELTEVAVEIERQRTVSALDASVNGHLQAIVSVARTILADPSSSDSLMAQAASIVETAGRASTSFQLAADEMTPTPRQRPLSIGAELSSRELEVVQFAAKGMSNPEIGEALFLARGTVKAYMESALRKLGARNRVEAVMIAARGGLLDDF